LFIFTFLSVPLGRSVIAAARPADPPGTWACRCPSHRIAWP